MHFSYSIVNADSNVLLVLLNIKQMCYPICLEAGGIHVSRSSSTEVKKKGFLLKTILVLLQENELDRYITFCDGKGGSDHFLGSHPKDFFEASFKKLF